MSYKAISTLFKIALSLCILSVFLLFFLDPGSAEQVITIISLICNFVLMVVTFIMMMRYDKK